MRPSPAALNFDAVMEPLRRIVCSGANARLRLPHHPAADAALIDLWGRLHRAGVASHAPGEVDLLQVRKRHAT